MKRLSIQLLDNLKARLDGLRATGTTAAGLIRHLLTQQFQAPGREERHWSGAMAEKIWSVIRRMVKTCRRFKMC